LEFSIWPALGATFALVGALWQTVVSALSHIDTMRFFLISQNEIIREEVARVRSNTSRYRYFKRRSAVKKVYRESSDLLSKDELRLSKRYDQLAWGWGLVTIGALIACTSTWFDFAESFQ
jgi:hypothetical protein